MTGDKSIFSTISSAPKMKPIILTDGSILNIEGVSSISLTPSLYLDTMLYVPSFPFNFLSKLIKFLNCETIFSPSTCVFQDLKKKTVVGSGCEDERLYYLNLHPSVACSSIIPYPGRGHINPMINICRLIATRGILITFVVTEEWLGLLSDAEIPSNLRLRFIPNVLPSEFTRGIDPNGFLDAVLTEMRAPFERLLDEIGCQKNMAIMADTYLPWAVAIGNQRNIPVYSLFTESATAFTIMYHNELLISNHNLPTANLSAIRDECVNYIPGIKSIRISDLHSTCFTKTPLRINTESFSWITKAHCILFTTSYVLESDVIDTLKSILPIPIYPIGPTIHLNKSANLSRDAHYYHWLNSQPKSSVLYVSFGSFLQLSEPQVNEIAAGLSASGVRYIWVMRANLCQTQIFTSNGNKGIMIPWCYQLEVLCHPSVGGFFTHCGWNSTLEGLYAGVPMLTFPLLFDQFPNSKLIVDDLKVGVRVKEEVFGDESLVGRDEIVKVVQMVMDLEGDDGKKLRARAAHIRETCVAALEEGGSSFANLDAFIRSVNGV